MNTITLVQEIKGKTIEFDVFISAWTAGKMDKAQELLSKYSDPAFRVNDIIATFETVPDFCREQEGMKIFLPLLEKMAIGELTKEQVIEKITNMLKATITIESKRQNGVILRELVRLMCLESELTSEQIKAIKSPIDSDFWQAQDAILMRDTGENFRIYVTEYTA